MCACVFEPSEWRCVAHIVPEGEDLVEDLLAASRLLLRRILYEARVVRKERRVLYGTVRRVGIRCEADAEEGVGIEGEEDIREDVEVEGGLVPLGAEAREGR